MSDRAIAKLRCLAGCREQETRKGEEVIPRRALIGIALPTSAGLLLAACGSSSHDGMDMGGTSTTTRTVNVDMTEHAFKPNGILVVVGERIKFVFTNNGTVDHDAFIGDAAAQAQHALEMKASTGDTHDDDHDMASERGVTVAAGRSGVVTTTFDKPATLEIGCHEPGHYEAGMKAKLIVS